MAPLTTWPLWSFYNRAGSWECKGLIHELLWLGGDTSANHPLGKLVFSSDFEEILVVEPYP
jgi:hypothetical protein